MSKGSSAKVIVIRPNDISLKVSEVAEKIISGIMETGELDVIGVSDAMFLACSATNMATEIARIYIDEICVDTLEIPVLGKIAAVSSHLSQTKKIDFIKLVEDEDSTMEQKGEQTISVSRGVKMDRLLTLCLLKFSKVDRLKIIAAGGAINEAISLVLKLITDVRKLLNSVDNRNNFCKPGNSSKFTTALSTVSTTTVQKSDSKSSKQHPTVSQVVLITCTHSCKVAPRFSKKLYKIDFGHLPIDL